MGRTSVSEEKVFRDNVHGYIRVPKIVVSEIIDTAVFQRLRNVEQTSMRSLFPAARHDRFIHSLGTYHLGCVAFDHLVENSPWLERLGNDRDDFDRNTYLKRTRLLFTLACLLHDCAHAPFSHTFERYYAIRRKDDEVKLDEELKAEYAAGPDFEGDFSHQLQESAPKEHERMSALMVGRYFREGISSVFEHEGLACVTSDELALMARMIMGCAYSDESTTTRSFENCLVRLLNSPTIDVDGLDYSTRDTVNSGINNASVDLERLLGALCVVEATSFCEGTRLSNASMEGVFTKGSELSSEGAPCGHEPVASLSGDFTLTFDGREMAERCYEELDDRGFEVRLQDREVAIRGAASLRLPVQDHLVRLTADGQGRIRLDGWSGDVRGGVLLAPESVCERASLEGGAPRDRCALAFDRSSLSVLEGALAARNHLYRTVYAHPQVVYRSSFLMHHLLRLTAKYLCCRRSAADFRDKPYPPATCGDKDECPLAKGPNGRGPEDAEENVETVIEEMLGLDGYFRPRGEEGPEGRDASSPWHFCRSDDSDLLALFKWVYLDNRSRGPKASNGEIERCFSDFFSRRGKVPVWKSYEEYRHLLNAHDGNEGGLDFGSLRRSGSTPGSLDYVLLGDPPALGEGSCPVIRDCVEKGWRGLLAVKASWSSKSLGGSSVLVRFDDGVERLCDVSGHPSTSDGAQFAYVYHD